MAGRAPESPDSGLGTAELQDLWVGESTDMDLQDGYLRIFSCTEQAPQPLSCFRDQLRISLSNSSFDDNFKFDAEDRII